MFTVKTPPVPELVTLVTPGSPICGLLLVAVGPYTTPSAVTVAPPSEVTLPPSVTVVPVTLAE